jgi:hypothetical protein
MGCRIGAKLALKRTAQLLLIAIAKFYGEAFQWQIGLFGEGALRLDTQCGPWNMEKRDCGELVERPVSGCLADPLNLVCWSAPKALLQA